jgi:hypothetical protein
MRAALLLCALAGTSRADDRVNGYVGGGLLAGGDKFLQVGFAAEAAVIPRGVPIGLRVGGMYGGEIDAEGGGSWYRIDVGADLRLGVSSAMTFLVGPTLGFQIENWGKPGPEGQLDDPPEHYTGTLLGGRIGFEITPSPSVRLRVVFEIYAYHAKQAADPAESPSNGGHLVAQGAYAF